MVFDSSETYLYSADLRANKIWTHKKAPDGTLTLAGEIEAPNPIDHPRWVAIHPKDTYLYSLMEAGNNLAVYKINPSTHLPEYTGKSYPLIPTINATHPKFKKMYRSDVVFLSSSAKYLFATTRSNSMIHKGADGITGYISVFKLDSEGAIERQLCMMPTPTSGGHSNAVSPAPWSDDWLALTDDDCGGVEIYKLETEGRAAEELGAQLARVARLELPDGDKHGGFGMNAIWYD